MIIGAPWNNGNCVPLGWMENTLIMISGRRKGGWKKDYYQCSYWFSSHILCMDWNKLCV